MNWELLFAKQEKLDNYIMENQQLENTNLFEERMLALLVELGELANETRCFKFWSKKTSSPKKIVLEEYVDNIHFLLSIGINTGYQFSEINIPSTNLNETEQFNYVFQKCLAFYAEPTENQYVDLFQAYLQLATLLHFSEADIF